jgi:hypothetical protein
MQDVLESDWKSTKLESVNRFHETLIRNESVHCIPCGNVEKSRQQRSRLFAVLTYYEYAPRVKMAGALPVEGRVFARLGWAGQTTNFEVPLSYCLASDSI